MRFTEDELRAIAWMCEREIGRIEQRLFLAHTKSDVSAAGNDLEFIQGILDKCEKGKSHEEDRNNNANGKA